MTTAEIEANADPQSLRLADWPIKSELKYNVIPEFMEDVGYVMWRRRYVTGTVGVGVNFLDVPGTNTHFSHMKEVYAYPTSGQPDLDNPLVYIGEEPRHVLAGKANTTPGAPGGYWLEVGGTSMRIFFDAPFDVSRTVQYFYDIHIKFATADENLDLNPFIPGQFQWALVEGLKREMYRHRSGVGDTNFQVAAAAFEAWKQRAKKSPELAQKRRYLYAR